MVMRFGEADLLEYNPRYSILICRTCEYAIQKSALESHLLRHKIYRGDRQRLLSSIAQLQLLEPQDVPQPAPGSLPIDGLPVLSGYRCTAGGCHHLTASSKRMKRHWSEIHGLGGSVPLSSSFARPVKLQTFFRGTKVRYFEVASLGSPPPAQNGNDEAHDEREDSNSSNSDEGQASNLFLEPQALHRSTLVEDGLVNGDFNNAGVVPGAITSASIPPLAPLAPLSGTVPNSLPSPSSVPDLDLDTLTYFYHFVSSTSLTLPGAETLQSTIQYWQMHVVPRALQRRWLMSGLLALSAYHLTTLTDDPLTQRMHREREAQFSAEFTAGLEETARIDSGFEAMEMESDSKKIGEQITCLLRCARWASAERTLDFESIAPCQLLSIMSAIRGCVTPDSTLRYSGMRQDISDRHEDELYLTGFLQPRESTFGTPATMATTDKTPSVLLNRLRALPFRIAEGLGRPESAQDVFATLSAITTVVECCHISFACDEAGAAWQGVTTWLASVPDHFNQMVLRLHPAALVVLAHCAAMLIKRAEHVGCWFLKGSAKTIVLQVAGHLSSNGQAVLGLVESLMGIVND